MGLSHYWEREIELPADRFGLAVEDCRKTLSSLDIVLAGFDGSGEPVISNDEIVFNGTDGLGCEPFVFKRTQLPRHGRNIPFSYCKTDHLPYDLCVKSALVILKHYLGKHLRVMSDGGDENWLDAKQACMSCVGYGTEFLLSSKK